MLFKIPFRFAVITMIVLLALVLIFHLLILLEVIPYTIVWGGKLNTKEEMRLFEFVSITLNALLLAVILIKAGLLKMNLRDGLLKGILWFFVVVFSLNTIGNLFAEKSLETIIFTPLTLVSAVLCLRIVREK